VGTVLGDTLEEIYREMSTSGPFSPDAASAGRRALRNTALTFLTARDKPQDRTRVADHYFKSSNMTDAAHGLMLLAAQPSPERDRALAHFYERWNSDHLVIDTWFGVQAQSPAASTLSQVKTLIRHPLFSLTAPNKVRALIGVFAMNNPVQFNRPDGAGYAFVAKQVLAIDRFNPSIAARLLAAFRNWHGLEQGRRAQARRTLQEVARAPEISRDVYEIVTKMLDQ